MREEPVLARSTRGAVCVVEGVRTAAAAQAHVGKNARSKVSVLACKEIVYQLL